MSNNVTMATGLTEKIVKHAKGRRGARNEPNAKELKQIKNRAERRKARLDPQRQPGYGRYWKWRY